jgi:hypothetical protein
MKASHKANRGPKRCAYRIVEDSSYRKWLKEKGYGFIAQVTPTRGGGVELRPVNKGVDLTEDELRERLAAVEER